MAAFLALIISANSLYRFMQSFFDLFGTASAILSHRSGVEDGNVFKAYGKKYWR